MEKKITTMKMLLTTKKKFQKCITKYNLAGHRETEGKALERLIDEYEQLKQSNKKNEANSITESESKKVKQAREAITPPVSCPNPCLPSFMFTSINSLSKKEMRK